MLFTGRNGPDQHYRTGPTECVENNWIGTFVSLGQKGNEPRICCPRGRAKASCSRAPRRVSLGAADQQKETEQLKSCIVVFFDESKC